MNFLALSLLYYPALTFIHDCWGNHSFDYTDFVSKVMSPPFNMLSRLLIAFLSRSNHLLILWLQSLSTVILEAKKRKPVTISSISPSICHEGMGLDAMILAFLIFSFKPALSLSSFAFIKRLFSYSLLFAIRVVSSAYLRLLMFLLPILIPACNSSSLTFLMSCLSHGYFQFSVAHGQTSLHSNIFD